MAITQKLTLTKKQSVEYDKDLERLYSHFVVYIQNHKISPGLDVGIKTNIIANNFEIDEKYLIRKFLELDYELSHVMISDSRAFKQHAQMRLAEMFDFYFNETYPKTKPN